MPMMSKIAVAARWGWAPCLAAVAALAASPASATTSLMREINADVSILAYVGTLATPSGFMPLDSDNESAFARDPGLLGGDALADVELRTYPFGSASSRSAGMWTSSDAGTIVLDWGWTLNASSGITVSTSEPMAWSYSFIASGDGVFNITGDVSFTGDPVGLNSIALGGSASGMFGGGFSDPSGSATYAIPILSGQTYQFTLENRGGRFSDTGLRTTSAGHATFAWNIAYGPTGPGSAPVPEPGIWMTMILGFGLAGSALRRARPGQVFLRS